MIVTVRIRLAKALEDVRDSYWFVPGLLATCGLIAALLLVLVDGRVGDDWLGQSDWFTGSRPEGARAVLSSIASSTITVAGVVFSITLAAVTYASGQHGPRLLSNFRRDRGNQVTLGVFIATFLYCLVVLRTVRTAAEASADTGGALREAFVPQIAVYGAFGLAIASMVVLVYFVHHVTDTIHINNVIARIGYASLEEMRCLPERGSSPANGHGDRTPETVRTIAAERTGYIAAIDHEALLEFACKHDLFIRILHWPGDFIHTGRALFEHDGPADDEAMAAELNGAVVTAQRRTALQDMRFRIDELVEIAARALSPGVNDPFTALACIDWLGAVASERSRRDPPRSTWRDEAGAIRVTTETRRFGALVETAFGNLRSYAAADAIAGPYLAKTLNKVITDCRDLEMRAALEAEQARLQFAISGGRDDE